MPVSQAALLAGAASPFDRGGDHRYHGWSSGADKAPWEQLLFIPGLPALGALFGAYLGWRLWKRLWLPRVVKDKPGGM